MIILGSTGEYLVMIADSVWGGNGWYLVVLGQYDLVLLGIKCN